MILSLSLWYCPADRRPAALYPDTILMPDPLRKRVLFDSRENPLEKGRHGVPVRMPIPGPAVCGVQNLYSMCVVPAMVPSTPSGYFFGLIEEKLTHQ